MTGRLFPRWLAALCLGLFCAVAVAAAPLAAPGRLAAVTLTATAAQLTWKDRAAGETEYRVEVRTIDGAFEDVGAVPAGSREAEVQGLQPATAYVFRIRAGRSGTFSDYSNEAAVTTFAVPGPCVADAQTLCLGGRFRVRAAWKAADGRAGAASVLPVPSRDSGILWFVSPDNLELLVKVLDGCADNGRHWIFTGPATNLQYLLTVTDTRTGKVRVYFNPQGVTPQAVTDTLAFAGCP
ncbi:MAG: fibronectin type III domain-containing protein [Thermoanaerobaculia bacterium]